MKVLLYLFFVILIPSFTYAQSPKAHLVGVGLYSELGHGYFYGGLYSEIESNDERTLLSYGGYKRMEMRVEVRSISPRKFRKLFNNMIAISNPSSVYETHGTDIAKFTNLLKGKLKKGDHVYVDNLNNATNVKINNEAVLTLDDPEFMNVLLKGWIGRFPPTAEFKQDVLGLTGLSHLPNFEKLIYTKERKQEVLSWYAAPKIDESTLLAAQKLEMEKALNRQLQAEREKARLTEKTKINAEEKKRLAILEAELKRKEALRQKALEVKIAKQRRIQQAQEEKRLKELARIQLIENQYHKNLIKAANKHVIYPPRAYHRGQEGYVKLKVNINSEGDIINIETEQSSKYEKLNKAAIKAVKKAAPYPAVPTDVPLEQNQYEFTIPFRFVAKAG